jgi:hypothetical protein
MGHKVVAHFLDGRLVKGLSCSVAPDHPVCHVRPPDQGTRAVPLAELKALFFVKDLAGNSDYRDQQVVGPADHRAAGATRLQITFRDGEQLVARAPTYEANRGLFSVLPADPGSNNVRILVNRVAVASIVVLPGDAPRRPEPSGEARALAGARAGSRDTVATAGA